MKWQETVQRIWADYVLTVGSLIFIVGLLPTVLSPDAHVPLATSLPTAAALLCFTPVQWIAFKARFGAGANFVTALMWVAVAVLRS